MDIRAALKEGMAQLRAAQVPSHTLATELLLMHALGRDRAWMYSHPEESIDPTAAERFVALIARRAAGEPVQYLTGKQEFWGLEFEVTPDVLIPRPETEHIMEVALARLGERGIKIHMDTGAPRESLRVADVGTGSGCLVCAWPMSAQVPDASPLRWHGNCRTPKCLPPISPRPRLRLRAVTPHATKSPIAFTSCNATF